MVKKLPHRRVRNLITIPELRAWTGELCTERGIRLQSIMVVAGHHIQSYYKAQKEEDELAGVGVLLDMLSAAGFEYEFYIKLKRTDIRPDRYRGLDPEILRKKYRNKHRISGMNHRLRYEGRRYKRETERRHYTPTQAADDGKPAKDWSEFDFNEEE